VEIRERSHGDSTSGDDDVMHLHFSVSSTVISLGEALIDAGHQLDAISTDSTSRTNETEGP
jgi:hypothetical protein